MNAHRLATMRAAQLGNRVIDPTRMFEYMIVSPVTHGDTTSGSWRRINKSLRAVQDALKQQPVQMLTAKVAATTEGKLLVTTRTLSGSVFCEETLDMDATTKQHMSSVRQKLMLPARVGKYCNLWTYADYRLQCGLENELRRVMDWKSADHTLFGSDVAVLAETGTFWTENWDERLVDFAQGDAQV